MKEHYPVFRFDRTKALIPTDFWGLPLTWDPIVSVFGWLFVRFGRGMLEHFIGKQGIIVDESGDVDGFFHAYLQSIYTNFFILCLVPASPTLLWCLIIIGAIATNVNHFHKKMRHNLWGLHFDLASQQAFIGIFNKSRDIAGQYGVGYRLSIRLRTCSLESVVFERDERTGFVKSAYNTIKRWFR